MNLRRETQASRNDDRDDDMLSQSARIGRHEASEERGVDLQRWKRVVEGLPVVRVEKVVAVREALRNNRYDSEAILAETVARVGNDLGILCRRELTDGYGSESARCPIPK